MKNNGKILRGCLAGLLIICIALPVFAFAREDAYIELPERIATSPGIAIEIPFNAPLIGTTVSRSNVYVVNEQGDRMPVARELGNGGKSIIVAPLSQYEPGNTYTLYIRKSVRYITGSEIKNGLKMKFTIAKAAKEPLPTLSSGENLRKLLAEAAEQNNYLTYGIQKKRNGVFTFDEATAAPAATVSESANSSKQAVNAGSGDYSTTNVQVNGVDEADIVKTDGKYLYQVNNNRIVVAEVYPSDKMKIKKVIGLEEEDMYPTELYLDDKRLVVIGTSNGSIPVYGSNSKRTMPSKHGYYNNSTVKMLIYDTANKDDIKKIREIELEGNYLSSRKIGSKLYLVSNKYLNYYGILENSEVNDTPSYRDTALQEAFINIGYEKIGYFPGSVEPNYMIAAGIDLDRTAEGINVSTYLGSGESIYASAENLYVAVTKHNIMTQDAPGPIIYDSAAPKKPAIKVSDRETVIYRFALNNGKLDYTGKGQVPGSILNQFSMDESKGYFRIATTKGDLWGEGENTSKNNLYVLDSDLNICGSLEDVAPGEKIYSTRFMGDRAYMVTFKKVDPLFVIDLKDAKNPKILGALKIPGYSDYLHPYDENHIIGFGKDTVELSNQGSWGKSGGTTAYYQGMKIALFDVSDVNNPKEKFKEIIGDRGTDSELLRDHKALLFSREKGLMAFPVTVKEIKNRENITEGNMPAYGSFAFQGAYIYNIDLLEGFKLKARISHISEEEYSKSGDRWYDSNKNVERIIYIGDDIYTISKGMIKANSIMDMKERGSLLIP